ncbi:hypothetical protein ACFFR8_03290 [Streptoalloteichus tenebrarius]|nr:hypothetical protein GCM10020241_65490 [Streptoalloteichus tenebrarius]
MVVKADAVGGLEWIVSVGSSIVRGPPSRRRRPEKTGDAQPGSKSSLPAGKDSAGPGARCTTIHLVVMGRGLAMRRADHTRSAGARAEVVIADKAYSHPSTRTALRGRRVTFLRPERGDQITRRTSLGGRVAGGYQPSRTNATSSAAR